MIIKLSKYQPFYRKIKHDLLNFRELQNGKHKNFNI